MSYDERSERIYVGGLDPSRGLTVELVASRLRSVEDVKIMCIDDDAIKNGTKRVIVDKDGDLVDTRNFFFIEACATAAAKSTGASALYLLAKQYHNVKWKGCQLRVEAAKPHFLKRLEDERALRLSKQHLDKRSSHISQADKEHEKATDEKVVKSRRRLRIRKRFGEEAYTVDTRPHPLELSQQDQDGWDEFTALNKRMHDKRQSQRKKLAERRKEERRKWASGKGFGKNHPTNSECDDLRSLIFLNRGIHIRFGGGSSSRREVLKEAVEFENSVADDHESVTSSSVLSSDSEESCEDEEDAKRTRKPYVWSDDDDNDAEEDSERDVSIEKSVNTNNEEHKTVRKHAWSDEDDGDRKDDTNDDQSTRSKGKGKKDELQEKSHHKVIKKRVDGSDYTKAVSIDEFSGGMDFDSAPNNFEDSLDDSRGSPVCSDSDNASDCQLENDICSNMGILATLFPNEEFEKQPLAASVSGSKGHASERAGVGEHGQSPNSSSVFRSGVIMQRYDPTKESDKRFEMPQTDEYTSKSNAKPRVQEEMDKDKESMNNTLVEDASASSGSSDNGVVSTKQGTTAEGPERILDKKPSTQADFKTSKKAEGESAPVTDIYEQDKLEDIFKQAREGMQSFSLANLFQGDEKVSKKEEQDADIYEQDKLEGVFKQAKADGAKTLEGAGFAFGFQRQLLDEKTAANDGSSAPFSFGHLSNPSKNENNLSSSQKSTEQVHNNYYELTPDDDFDFSSTVKATEEQLINEPVQRKRREGMGFPDKDLDVYEEMFFSLNEGPQILKDLDAMKQDEESQKQWEKERLGLTADWKRKQKSALSRKARKVRRL